MNEAIRDNITQRRHQILVHSCIYYQYNTNIIDDHTYDRWATTCGISCGSKGR
ncbi:DNA ligase LigA-related protein [Bacillus cereus]